MISLLSNAKQTFKETTASGVKL